MKYRALKRMELELSAASSTIANFAKVGSHEEMEFSWKQFLGSIDFIEEQMKAGKSGKSTQFVNNLFKSIKDGKLTNYLSHARNADHHTLAEVIYTPLGRRWVYDPAVHGSGIISSSNDGGLKFTPSSADASPSSGLGAIDVGIIDYRFCRLIDVVDRGQLYQAPTASGFEGDPLSMTVEDAARMAWSFYEAAITEARTFTDERD